MHIMIIHKIKVIFNTLHLIYRNIFFIGLDIIKYLIKSMNNTYDMYRHSDSKNAPIYYYINDKALYIHAKEAKYECTAPVSITKLEKNPLQCILAYFYSTKYNNQHPYMYVLYY